MQLGRTYFFFQMWVGIENRRHCDVGVKETTIECTLVYLSRGRRLIGDAAPLHDRYTCIYNIFPPLNDDDLKELPIVH